MDKLENIYNKQLELQNNLGNNINIIYKNQEYININILALLDELSEALRETAWKNPYYIKFGWKKHQELNIDNFKGELVDILHFFINLCIACGMTPEELFNRYMDKNYINNNRKKEGY